jgi:hypothetical protein
MDDKKKLNQFACPLKLQQSTFHWVDDFPVGSVTFRAGIYDDNYENFDPHIIIPNSIFNKAPAEKVFQLTMDFNSCPFTANKKGYLKLFLHPDNTVLGNAHFELSSAVKKDYLVGKYFLKNEYIYLELTWESQAHNRTLNIWGWADLATGSIPAKLKPNKNKKRYDYQKPY